MYEATFIFMIYNWIKNVDGFYGELCVWSILGWMFLYRNINYSNHSYCF